jgi:predicted O-methyltransferase YrrM
LDLPLQQLEHIAHKLRIGDRKYAKKTICGELYLNSPYANKIKQLYGDSARFDFSPYFNNIDMVFVDGAHSYDYVVNDSEIALKLIGSKKGIIVWHDSILNEIADAIHYVLGKNQLKGSCSLIKGTTIAFALIELHNSYL